MKLQLSDEQVKNVQWVQWKNRGNELRAHAVDPTSQERTGKLRTLTGAIVPTEAVPAEDGTEKDAFSLQLVEKAHANYLKHRTPKPVAEKPAKPAKEAAAEKPADPSKAFELRASGQEAQLWSTAPYNPDHLATFPKAKVDMTAPYTASVKLDKTPATFSIRQGGKVVAKGNLDRLPTTSAA